MADFLEFARLNWFLFVALGIIVGWLVSSEVMRLLHGVANVNPTQALQLINRQDAIVLDIREAGDYKTGHIPAARHLPMSKLQGRLGELQKFKDKPIIVYSGAGGNVGNACNILKKNGFSAVHQLSGGLPAWQNANLPVTKK